MPETINWPATVREAIVADAVQRWETGKGPQWNVRIGGGLLAWALANDESVAVLDRMLAAGEIVLADPKNTGMATVRLAMPEHTDDHIRMIKLARSGRLYTVEKIFFYTGHSGGTAQLSDDEITAAGDLLELGYLANTRRPGPDGTTCIEPRFGGLDALREWGAA